MKEDVMKEIKWNGNSKKMYELVLSQTPLLFKNKIIRLVSNWINDHKIELITEEVIFEIVEDIAPLKIKVKLLPVLKNMRTNG
ncbi:Uncharacterised protein [Clostridium putrefaciens]|uniref:Uncharacterized protein n=1 Tax=Clostridium putrefaciens TaxID=99675 RepID=A0A381JC50_9CLOT|nr:hypothetical protein [Clostridium putrefaciens]SUY47967.1 Uncharacterised protein [Clostridium putrefaciens]